MSIAEGLTGMHCWSCGTENAATTKFCAECGASLRPAEASGVEGERRQLTVFFADLVGSTALSESLDPEDLQEVIKEYQAACGEVITRYEGHVAQYLGDGVVAYFGYPAAHEDDAVRSVLAGLEIVERVDSIALHGHRLRVRVGIHTGGVVTGEIGGRREQVAFGEVPNIAARIQGEADPGTVVISETTRRLVAGHFALDDRGAHELKGISQPVQLFRVVERSGAKRFDAAAALGLAPFVGREEEVEAIRTAWDASARGAGRTLVLRGEPGIGKSRLLGVAGELARGAGCEVLEAECSPHNLNSALFPVVELLKDRLGFKGHDDTEKLELLEEFTTARGLPADDAVPLLASLLAIPVEGRYQPVDLGVQEVRDRTLAVLADLLLSSGGPSLLTFEDLHWADPSTLELVATLVRRQAAVPLLMICTTRPEFSIPWPPASHWREISVEALPETNTRALIAGVVGEKPLPGEVADEITRRTGGVPLFVEAVTRTIIESGVLRELDDRFELDTPLPPGLIPDTLQDSLRARIDRLGPDKPVAQLAATIGREFGFDLLQIVSGQSTGGLVAALDRLIALGLVSQFGEPPESVYLFRHALIQDAAYESLLRKTRQEFHRKIASALLEHFPSIPAQRPELVAEHFTAAGLPEQAIPYWLAAGQLALARGANYEALAHLRRGLGLLLELPDADERAEQELEFQAAIALGLTPTQGWASRELGRTYARASGLLEVLPNSPHRMLILGGTFAYHFVSGRITAAYPIAYEALEVATLVGDPTLLAIANWYCCVANAYHGSPRKAVEHGEATLALMDPEREQAILRAINLSASVNVGAYMVEALWTLGYPDQARAMSSRTVALARELEHKPSLAYALCYEQKLDHLLRDPVPMVELADEIIVLSREERLAFWEPTANVLKGWALAAEGRLEEGIALARDGLGRYRAAGNGILYGYQASTLAESLWSAGHHIESFAALEEAMSLAASTGDRYYEPEFHRLKGEFLRDQARGAADAAALLAEAESSSREAVAIARLQEARSLELRAAMSLCRVRRDQGESASERPQLAEVYEWFTEGFDTPDLRDARALLAELGAG